MARPSAAARNLSLTEELERLEQSITLTLQEIDHNFSKAHRIVTTSILPVVEQYGEHSRSIWEASKFWKQFFEASANVSLSGYEELNKDDDTTMMEESTAMRDDTDMDAAQHHDDAAGTPHRDDDTLQDESMLDDAELAGSTPRPPSKRMAKADMSDMESPYEAMRREMKTEEDGHTTVLEDEDSSVLFAQQTARLPDMTMTPNAILDERNKDPSGRQKDPLLHRVLDKNYRIQATPHKPTAKGTPVKSKGTGKDTHASSRPAWQDSSPMSSPDIAIPKLRSEAFMSPYKSTAAPAASSSRGGGSALQNQRLAAAAAASSGPRTPGVSVQTPMARKTRQSLGEGDSNKGKQRDEIYWDSDEDDDDLYAGMSPPKTIQFALPPSKLLQTPAREASKRIVDDILMDAGADPESSEYSPTMVKMNEDILNDSF